MQKWLVVAALILLQGAGCSRSSQEPAAAAPKCEKPPGPPTDDFLRCKFRALSDVGATPRKLSDADIEQLIGALRSLATTSHSVRRGESTVDTYVNSKNSLERTCLELSGLSCDTLFSLEVR